MTAIEPAFRERIGPFRLERLDRSASPVCGLWPDLRIAYTNAAWSSFAAENRGPEVPLGSGYLDVVAPVLRPFYERLLRTALAGSERVDHDYECSTPDAFRIFRMSIYPLTGGAGLLIAHSLLVEQPHDDPGAPPVEARYRDAHGLIHQCAHCRRTRRAEAGQGAASKPSGSERGLPGRPRAEDGRSETGDAGRKPQTGWQGGEGESWDWVPGFVRHPPDDVSHGLCPPCTAYYYGDWV